MSKVCVVRRVAVVVAVTGAVQIAGAQTGAPASAQRWEQRFKIERFGEDGTTLLSTSFSGQPITYNTALGVGRVEITYQGRVAILPNTSSTSNLGVARLGGLGGATSGFRMQFVDQVSITAHKNQGILAQGVSSGTATGGVPSTGLFSAFRGAFFDWTPAANASNTDVNNGWLFNNTTSSTASPILANVVGGRSSHFGDGPGGDLTDDAVDGPNGQVGTGGPVGVATVSGADLVGDFADYYKVAYAPRSDTARLIQVNVTGVTGRYVRVYGGNGLAGYGPPANLPDTSFTFAVASTVPAPGGSATLALAGVLAARRRRRGG